MKLSWKDIDAFVAKPNPKARAILVYGPDDGLVKERAAIMAKATVADIHDPFNVALLTGEILSDDSARLSDEANAMSLMGGARLIRVDGASDKHTTILKEYLANPSMENLVILEAGELGTKSSLRALFEKLDNAAAVPCYIDDERGVTNLIKQTLSANGFTIQSDAVTWLATNIAGDRLRVRMEIDKLMIYMGTQTKNITLDDVQASCGEAGDQSLEDLIYAVGNGRIDAALKSYNKLIEEGVAVVTILRSLQNHYRRLHYTKSLMQSGLGMDEAMKKLQPAVFFKVSDSFKSQLRKWPEGKLLNTIQRLSNVEAQTKQTGTPVETLCSQVILSLAAQG